VAEHCVDNHGVIIVTKREDWAFGYLGNDQYGTPGEIRKTYRPLRLKNTLEEGRAHAENGAMSVNFDTMIFDDDIRIFRLVEDRTGKS
jgi:hypothetical protein